MSTIRVKAAVVDTRKLLLYKEDGSTISIPQGDPRIKALVEQIVPLVNAGEIAEIDLQVENQYRDFEAAQIEGGFVRFFKTARSKLGGLFKTEEVEDVPTGVFGEIPVIENLNTAIEEIIAHSVPASDPEFSTADIQPHETMIAVVENEAGETQIIPGVELMQHIFEHSAKHRHTIGVQALLKRMAGYVKDRQHSVEDLLRFLEKGDLPISDDGCIIAYKSLYRREEGGEVFFVDPHTQKVRQKVGSYVCVAEELVDKNRRNECSNGLHIGRRAYMRGFSGNAMMLCKIKPEDVIVVPHGDPNKVRVCGYHILAHLPDKVRQQIKDNKPMTEITGIGDLLANVLKGNHVDVLETVEITQQAGEGLVITPTGKVRKLGANRKKDAHPAATAIDDERNAKPKREASTVDVKEVAKVVTGSRQARAIELMTIVQGSTDLQHMYRAACDLVAFQKKVKIGWSRLGLSAKQVELVRNIASGPVPVAPKAPAKSKAKKGAKKAKTRSKAPQRPVKPIKQSDPKVVAQTLVKDTPAPASKALTKADQARQWRDQLFGTGLNDAQTAVIARKMLDARRQWKKSWAALGCPDVSDDELKKIINAAPVDVPHVMPELGAGNRADRKPAQKAPKPKPTAKEHIAKATAAGVALATEMDLSPERKAALALVRGGKTVSAASKETGVHRRTIDRDVEKYGK